MRLQVLKHAPFEGPAGIAAWARARGHALSVTELQEGQPLPGLDAYDGLVLMGGPMSVHDGGQWPWLGPEKGHLSRALAAGKRLLGVCLGAQLLAEALGGEVRTNPVKELGWHPVEWTPQGREHPWSSGFPPALTVLHWHGETFSLPPGAVPLLRSAGCEAQGFAWGRQVLALQCHLEMDGPGLQGLLDACRQELAEAGPWIQSEAQILAQAGRMSELQPWLALLLDRWAEA